jgi:hypothetical protein
MHRYLKLLISTMSLIVEPRATANRSPNGDQANRHTKSD